MDSFHALLAVAMAIQIQGINGLAHFQAVSLRPRSARPAVPVGLKVPLTSPDRKRQARDNRAEKAAYKQTQDLKERMGSVARSESLHTSHSQQPHSAASLPQEINDGVLIVYPGHAGEPFWTEWQGR